MWNFCFSFAFECVYTCRPLLYKLFLYTINIIKKIIFFLMDSSEKTLKNGLCGRPDNVTAGLLSGLQGLGGKKMMKWKVNIKVMLQEQGFNLETWGGSCAFSALLSLYPDHSLPLALWGQEYTLHPKRQPLWELSCSLIHPRVLHPFYHPVTLSK